jgi:hypothetical protein
MECLWRQLVDVCPYVPIPLSLILFLVELWHNTRHLCARETNPFTGIRLNYPK